MDCSTPGFPVHHQLLEVAQIHVHRVSDAIQPSHLLSSPSLPAFSLSQHQSLFQWVFFTLGVQIIGVSISVSVLPMNIQDWFSLGWTGWVGIFLSILFSWSVFVFMPVLYQFHYCSFVICFEFRKYEALTFVLLFPYHFCYSEPFLVLYEC